MAKRLSVYMDDETHELYEDMKKRMNSLRRSDAEARNAKGGRTVKYQPITDSELFRQILQRANRDEKQYCLQQLKYHNDMYQEFAEKVKELNRTFYGEKGFGFSEVENG